MNEDQFRILTAKIEQKSLSIENKNPNILSKNISDFFITNFNILPNKIAVAVSGGSDSMALTLLLHDFCVRNKIKLFAVTINHNMRKSSENEAQSVNQILTNLTIDHKIINLSQNKIPQSNVEAVLRHYRYELIHDFCLQNEIEYLFTAHILSDVAENFLIRLFRGSQIDGLSSISEVYQYKNIKICRPLLNVDKSDLQLYLQDQNLKFFEDETNSSEKFLRNKIRNFLNSFEDKKTINQRIKFAAESLKEDKEIINEILLKNAKECLIFKGESFFIDLDYFKKIPSKISLKILSLVLMEIGGKNYKPRLKNLIKFQSEILNLQKGKKRNFYNCYARIISNSSKDLFALPKSKDFIQIYCEVKKNDKQKFDDKFEIVGNRILQDKNGFYKFYFRTILKEIFDEK